MIQLLHMFHRSLKNHFAYKRYRKRNPDGCGFCIALSAHTDQVVRIEHSLTILRNLFPYKFWDGRKVIDHVMIVPARHITNLAAFTPDETMEYFKILAEYESDGYSFYIRSDANRSKSMAHLHGHLLKTS